MTCRKLLGFFTAHSKIANERAPDVLECWRKAKSESSEERKASGLLKQCLLPAAIRSGTFDAEVVVGELRSYAAALRAIEKSDLDQKRLVDLLNGVRLLSQRAASVFTPTGPP